MKKTGCDTYLVERRNGLYNSDSILPAGGSTQSLQKRRQASFKLITFGRMRVIQVFPLFVAITALLLLAVSVFAEEAREGQQTENAVVELQRLLHTKLLVDVEKHVLATANELGSTYVEPQWTPKTWESYNFWKRYQPTQQTLNSVTHDRIIRFFNNRIIRLSITELFGYQ